MNQWSQKTTAEKQKGIDNFFYNFVFKATFASEPFMHFEKTKAYLMDNIFDNNHIACHTHSDYYLDSSVASKASSKLVSKIIESKGHADGEDFAKLENAICKADKKSVEQMPWFLKWSHIQW